MSDQQKSVLYESRSRNVELSFDRNYTSLYHPVSSKVDLVRDAAQGSHNPIDSIHRRNACLFTDFLRDNLPHTGLLCTSYKKQTHIVYRHPSLYAWMDVIRPSIYIHQRLKRCKVSSVSGFRAACGIAYMDTNYRTRAHLLNRIPLCASPYDTIEKCPVTYT